MVLSSYLSQENIVPSKEKSVAQMSKLINQYHDSNTWTYEKHLVSKNYPDLTCYDQNKILKTIDQKKIDGLTREQEGMINSLKNAKKNEPFLLKDFNIDPNTHKTLKKHRKSYSMQIPNQTNKSVEFENNQFKNNNYFNSSAKKYNKDKNSQSKVVFERDNQIYQMTSCNKCQETFKKMKDTSENDFGRNLKLQRNNFFKKSSAQKCLHQETNKIKSRSFMKQPNKTSTSFNMNKSHLLTGGMSYVVNPRLKRDHSVVCGSMSYIKNTDIKDPTLIFDYDKKFVRGDEEYFKFKRPKTNPIYDFETETTADMNYDEQSNESFIETKLTRKRTFNRITKSSTYSEIDFLPKESVDMNQISNQKLEFVKNADSK